MLRSRILLVLAIVALIGSISALTVGIQTRNADGFLAAAAGLAGLLFGLRPVDRTREQLIAAWKWTIVLVAMVILTSLTIGALVSSDLVQASVSGGALTIAIIGTLILRRQLSE